MTFVHVTELAGVKHRRPAGWLWLFAGASAATVIIGWFTNEYVLTRSTYHQLLDARLAASRVDAQFDFMQQVAIWGYLAAPVVLAIRLVVVAMTAQLFLLLFRDVPFRVVFRAACWAYAALCAAFAARAVYLYLLPPELINQGSLQIIPSSLASVLMYSEDFRSPLYSLLNLLNVFELAWCVIFYQLIRSPRDEGVTARAALTATAGTWVLLATLQWAFSAYFASLS
ncbi:MAG TPA: hypothetical protein VIF32_10145 [Gemmatimonadaceae bacterium]